MRQKDGQHGSNQERAGQADQQDQESLINRLQHPLHGSMKKNGSDHLSARRINRPSDRHDFHIQYLAEVLAIDLVACLLYTSSETGYQIKRTFYDYFSEDTLKFLMERIDVYKRQIYGKI